MKTQSKFKVGKTFIHIDSSFKDWFYNIDFKPKETKLFSKRLERDMLDSEILEEFKPSELTLGEVYNYLITDSKKEDRMMFYCRDNNNMLRAVYVIWYGSGWDIGAGLIIFKCMWRKGVCVLSSKFKVVKKSVY